MRLRRPLAEFGTNLIVPRDPQFGAVFVLDSWSSVPSRRPFGIVSRMSHTKCNDVIRSRRAFQLAKIRWSTGEADPEGVGWLGRVGGGG